jgi:16S rRNA (guanine527-N7)-methyltransferase
MAAPTDQDRIPGLALSDEQTAKLKVFEALLVKWQPRLNLVANSTMDQIWRRHILDSLQLVPLAGCWRRWIDIGSGAGFPGLVAAIAGPAASVVHLIESDRRKSAFLLEVSRETGAAVQVHADRIERILPKLVKAMQFDIISARALAPMDLLMRYAEPVLRSGGRGLFLKGKELAPELTNLEERDTFSFEIIPSVVELGANIVSVRSLKGYHFARAGAADGRS